MIWVDTSALIAVLDADQTTHDRCKSVWAELVEVDAPMATSNYCVLETTALVQARLGMKAVRTLHSHVLPMMAVQFVGANDHSSAMAMLLADGRRKMSLVDITSFEMMRQRGIGQAFTLGKHYKDQGFDVIPSRKKGV